MSDLTFRTVGLGDDAVDYLAAWDLQRDVHAAVVAGELPPTVLFLEHPPVFTAGKRTDPHERPADPGGADVIDVDRGGKITFHGPGQLVGYPIMGISDVVAYLRTMERAISAALADEGIGAGCREGLTGVWVGERKIGSIGVHVSRGVTTHGFAINVVNDLQPFNWVVPCGLDGVQMTSVQKETGAGDLGRFRAAMAARFAEHFGADPRLVEPEAIGAAAALAP